MPTHAPTPCRSPYCPSVAVSRGYCMQHAQTKSVVRAPEQRGNSAQRGYGSQWRAYALRYLARHQTCRQCDEQGRASLAQCVDHIEPCGNLGVAHPLFWIESNHQPLCRRCHAAKTKRDEADGRTRT